MGEKHSVQIADRLAAGEDISSLTDVLGTCYAVKTEDYMPITGAKECASYELVKEPDEKGKRLYAVSCKIQQDEHDAVRGRTVIQRHGDKIVVQNPPMPPLTTEEFQQLENNILADGVVINPIIIWDGVIVDGHTRYRIVSKHPEIQFSTCEKTFADRYEAIAWICKNQLGRRNLTQEQKKYLIGKQ